MYKLEYTLSFSGKVETYYHRDLRNLEALVITQISTLVRDCGVDCSADFEIFHPDGTSLKKTSFSNKFNPYTW